MSDGELTLYVILLVVGFFILICVFMCICSGIMIYDAQKEMERIRREEMEAEEERRKLIDGETDASMMTGETMEEMSGGMDIMMEPAEG